MNQIAKTLLTRIGEGALVGFHPCTGQHFFGSAFYYDIGTTEAERGFIIIVPGGVKEFHHGFLSHFEGMPVPKLPDVVEEKPESQPQVKPVGFWRGFWNYLTWN